MLKKLKSFEGAAALLTAAFIYATFGLLIREIAKMLSTGAQTAARFALAAVLAAATALIARKGLRLPKKELLLTLALGVVFGFVVLLYTISVTTTTIANSVFLLYAGSIFSSFLIGTFILKEKVTTIKVIAIIVGLAGLAMYSHAFLTLSVGVTTGFASGLFDGGANAIRKKLKGVDRNLVIAYSFAIGAVLAFIVALLSGGELVREVSLLPVVTLIIFAVLLVFLSNLLLFGFQHFDVNVGTVILASELFFAMILGYIVFHEQPSLNEIVGGVLIFIASVVASIDVSTLPWRKKPAVL